MKLFGVTKREGKIFPSLFKYLSCLSILFHTSIIFAYGQNNNEFPKPFQFGFTVASTLIDKPKVTREFGKANLITRNTFGFEIGATLKYVLNRNTNILSGISYGKLPFSWGFDFKQGEFSSVHGNSYSDKGSVYLINYWYLPFNVEEMLWNNGRQKFNAIAGINIRHFLDGQTGQEYDYGFLDTAKLNYPLFLMVLDVNFPYRLRLNYQLGVTSDIELKNLNDIKVSLLYNFSFARIVKGYYGFFQDTSEYTFGLYSMTGSYLTLTFGYVLTGERKLKQKRKDY